jgi:hypothetical protein
MNISIFIKAPWFEWQVYFLLVNLIRMIYLTIYQIEHLINLNKKKLPWSKCVTTLTLLK